MAVIHRCRRGIIKRQKAHFAFLRHNLQRINQLLLTEIIILHIKLYGGFKLAGEIIPSLIIGKRDAPRLFQFRNQGMSRLADGCWVTLCVDVVRDDVIGPLCQSSCPINFLS